MNTVYQTTTTRTPRQQYYAGFDARCDEFFHGRSVDLASLTHYERKGYDAACRAQADADTDGWLTYQAEQAARQREVDAAQDSAAAANWPASGLW